MSSRADDKRSEAAMEDCKKNFVMPLSKHHIDTNTHPVAFDLERLGYALESELTDVLFAYVHGSAAHTGVVAPHSDLDIALLDDHLMITHTSTKR